MKMKLNVIINSRSMEDIRGRPNSSNNMPKRRITNKCDQPYLSLSFPSQIVENIENPNSASFKFFTMM